MEQEKLEGYLRKIEELVFDEEKIVTYKYLSRVLDVHVNTAKQLLYKFLMKQQKHNTCNISVTYLLAGSLKNGDNVVSIVNEDDMNEACTWLDKITSKHVYSVLKGKEADVQKIKDMLYIVDTQVEPLERCPVYYNPGIVENICEVKNVELKISPKSEENIKETSKTKKSIPRNDKGSVLNFFNNSLQPKKAKKETTTVKVENGDGTGKIAEIELSQLKVDEGKKKKEKISKRNEKKRKRIVSDSESSENDEEKEDAMLCGEDENLGNLDNRDNEEGGEGGDNGENLENGENGEDEVGPIRTKRKRKKVVDQKINGLDGFIETVKQVTCETDSEGEMEQQEKKVDVKSVDNTNVASIPEQDQGKTKNRNLESKTKGQRTLLSFFKKN